MPARLATAARRDELEQARVAETVGNAQPQGIVDRADGVQAGILGSVASVVGLVPSVRRRVAKPLVAHARTAAKTSSPSIR